MVYYVIIRGPLGIGKSSVAEALAKSLHGEHLSVDAVLHEHDLEDKSLDGFISEECFLKANEIIAPQALSPLQSDKIVIFDGNFYRKSQIEDLIAKLNFEHFVFTLKAPLEVCIGRDRDRDKTHGEDAARVVYRISTSFKYGTEIDTTDKTRDQVVEEILSYLPRE